MNSLLIYFVILRNWQLFISGFMRAGCSTDRRANKVKPSGRRIGGWIPRISSLLTGVSERRLRAVVLKQQGWHQRDIGHALGISEETVCRWLALARDGGPAALRARPRSGHPPKLSADQKRLIPEFLWHGAEAYGFRGEVWTCARVACVIEEDLVFAITRGMSDGSSRSCVGRPRSRSSGPSRGTKRPSNAGETRSGRNCSEGRDASAGRWFWRTNPGSTPSLGWSGRTPPIESGRGRCSSRIYFISVNLFVVCPRFVWPPRRCGGGRARRGQERPVRTFRGRVRNRASGSGRRARCRGLRSSGRVRR